MGKEKKLSKPNQTLAPRKAVADSKRPYFRQSDFPQTTLQKSQRIAASLVDNFGATEGSPPDIALDIGASPTSSSWRELAGSDIAYGLTEGGHNADKIKLLPLGKLLVSPVTEGDDLAARLEAVLKPRICREFFERYRRAKFPNDIVGAKVLADLGLPADRASAALEIVKANGRYAGIIRETPHGPFVNLDSPVVPPPATTSVDSENDDTKDEEGPSSLAVKQVSQKRSAAAETPTGSLVAVAKPDAIISRVFITHGRQRTILVQIKELLAFGQFEPIISVERESTAIPVPDKVFEDMRSCAAGVIHVGAEGKYLDHAGNEHVKINDNVLIEIGAAMALYGKKVVLLVERGVTLPSNLQGLYRCEYEGDRLDYDATMKLLKTFNQFR
jgi:predicted nucleotide-binding protein